MTLWPAIVVMYGLALLGLSLYGLNQAALCLVFWRHRPRERKVAPCRDSDAPVVTIQLPLYNEVYVAERVIRSACSVDYPPHLLEIQVLDDSTDETVELTRELVAEYQARGVSIAHLHRQDRRGYKSGALANGLRHARGELIAIFDADFVIPADFLRQIVPHFADPSVGIVQTRWSYLNETDSEMTRAMALALDGHFVVEQSARPWAGWFSNFNGTGGMLRARAIADAGGWQDDTLTEDLDLSYRMQLAGWRVTYRRDVACPSEIPTDIHSLKTQQFRWTKGVQETAQKILPSLWRSHRSLSIKFEGTLHLLGALAYPLLTALALLSPGALVASATHHVQLLRPIVWLNWGSILGSLALYTTATHDLGSGWRSRMLRFPLFLVLSIGLSAHNTRAALEAIVRKKSPFERTPKYREAGAAGPRSFTRYRSRASWSTVAEFVLAAWAIVSVVVALRLRYYGAIPFQMLFVSGYLLVGIHSVRHMRSARAKPRRGDLPLSVQPAPLSHSHASSSPRAASVA
jgi:cellulose synthase/poly-beta-1,6-N-acetylglucosamine synthase-like glycosyltransferase